MEENIPERKRQERKKSIIFWLLIIWSIYPFILGYSGSCSLWTEPKEDGWYIYTELGDYDDAGAHTWIEIVEGPLSKSDAQALINNCEEQSEWFLNRFGTIYKYLWKFNESAISRVVSGLISALVWLGPWWLFDKWISSNKT